METYKQRIERSVQNLQVDLKRDKDKRNLEKVRRKEHRAFSKLPPAVPRMEFWCDYCVIDFVAPSYKSWSSIHETGSWHSFCPMCERIVYRHITSKVLDPYYAKSDKLKVMRGEAVKDIIQPTQYGYKTMYGDPFEHYYKRFQEGKEALRNKYASMGLIGKTLNEKHEEQLLKEDFDM